MLQWNMESYTPQAMFYGAANLEGHFTHDLKVCDNVAMKVINGPCYSKKMQAWYIDGYTYRTQFYRDVTIEKRKLCTSHAT